MNIFFLDENLALCARYHCDKHSVKMITEYNQLLCTAMHNSSELCIDSSNIPYRQTHLNHPSAIWVREHPANFMYLIELNKHLCSEYTYRYNRIHKGEEILSQIISNTPEKVISTYKNTIPRSFNLAISSEIKKSTDIAVVVDLYRKYYLENKRHIAKWKNRTVPHWWK